MSLQHRYGLRIGLKVVVRGPCPTHVDPLKVREGSYWKKRFVTTKRWPFFGFKWFYELPQCDCEKPLVGIYENPDDLGTTNFTNLTIMNIFDSASDTNALTDITNTTHTGTANSATSNINLHMGAGTTAVAPADYQIEVGAYDWSTIAATVHNTVAIAGATSFYTITGTFTNSTLVNKTAGNVGLELDSNVDGGGAATFLASHDNINGSGGGGGYVISPAGTAAVTYTITVT